MAVLYTPSMVLSDAPTVCRPDGTGPRKKFSLEELQNLVGGYVESINMTEGRIMLVDEDGEHKSLLYNNLASLLAGQRILGNALILERDEWE